MATDILAVGGIGYLITLRGYRRLYSNIEETNDAATRGYKGDKALAGLS